MSTKVKGLILITGEELIVEIVESITPPLDTVKIRRPRILAIMRTPDGREGLGLIPWAKSGKPDEVHTINKNHLLTQEPYDVNAEVERVYVQETSGLQLASAIAPAR